jgi:hypothetical protein
MASKFYGSVRGQANNSATRRGSKNSGLCVWAQNDVLQVCVRLFVLDGRDYAEISLLPSTINTGISGEACLFSTIPLTPESMAFFKSKKVNCDLADLTRLLQEIELTDETNTDKLAELLGEV